MINTFKINDIRFALLLFIQQIANIGMQNQAARSFKLTADSHATAERKPEARSRIGNGKSLFLGTVAGEPVDGRTVQARVFRDTLAEIVGDLGGRDAISEGEYQLARRAAALAVECLIAESHQATGKRLDLETFIPAVNALNRCLGNLGLRRRQKDITPDPLRYIEGGG